MPGSKGSETMDPAEAQRIVTFKKRNFTRQFNALGKLTAFAGANPSPYAITEIDKGREKLHKAYGELCDSLDLFLELDPTSMKDYEIISDESQHRFEDMIERSLATLKDIGQPSIPPCLLYTSPSPRD